TRTFTARDGCGNTATASTTVTWTADNIAPLITAPAATTLGCNPSASDISAALGSATATDACSAVTITSSDAPAVTDNCSVSQTRTFTARDGCGNTATASTTVTWTADNIAPLITVPAATTLGCNPSASDISAALGSATAKIGRASGRISSSDAPAVTDNCSVSQTRTFTARDGCGNTATASTTVTWTADNRPMTITSPAATTLGCNPSASDISAALGSATATDACSAVTITSSDAPAVTDNCSVSQTRTFTARDGCGNTATASTTVTWTADNTPTTITAPAATTLGCNPSASDISAALGSATA